MQPLVMNFINMLYKSKSTSRVLAILSEHPKLIQSLAQWNAIYIVNNQPVVKTHGLQYPCSRRELVTNTVANIKSIVNGSQFHDESDPMSVAYHHPITLKISDYTRHACKSLQDNLSAIDYQGLTDSSSSSVSSSSAVIRPQASNYSFNSESEQSSIVSSSVSQSSSNLNIDKIFGSSSAPQIISNKADYELKSSSPLLSKILSEYNPHHAQSTKLQTRKMITNALQGSVKSTSLSAKSKIKAHKSKSASHIDKDMDSSFHKLLNSASNTSDSVSSSASHSKAHSQSSSAKSSSDHNSSSETSDNSAVDGKNPF